jgi:methyltransferase (TIGR00027 family)
MERRGPGQTAISCALLRAAHDLLDDAPKILADSFARDLVGLGSDAELRKALDADVYARLPDFPRLRTVFALRSRYTEDELGMAVQRGISQYVILGAGLDSFAHRRGDLMHVLHVYEVDHLASQSWKRARLAELGIPVPPTLHYVPLDLRHATLRNGLAAGGVARDAKAFFSWLGVTQYLPRDVVLNTLREIVSAAAPGSELVVQFVVPPATLTREDAGLVTALADIAASIGEPYQSFFEPEDLQDQLKQIGFDEIVHFGPEEATKKYLLGRTDGLRLPGYFRMIKACVGVVE